MQLQERLLGGDSDIGDGAQTSTSPAAQQQSPRRLTQPRVQDPAEPGSVIEQAYQDRFKKWDKEPDTQRRPQRLREQVQAAEPQQNTPQTPAITVRQIGYEALQPVNGMIASPNVLGVVQDSYVLGVGDQISVTLRGERSMTYRVVVGRDGQAIIPNLQPLTALGRTFGEFRDELNSLVGATMIQTEAFVSLGTVRQMSVLVSGEVQSPGMVSVTGLSSVLDALIHANGIRKSGTLRRVQLIRGDQTTTIDLYPVLLGGGASTDLSLREGDRIVVPPVGSTVAISGLVNRPGIYELTGNKITAQQLLRWAGGTLSANGNRYTKDSIAESGRASLTELSEALNTSLARGDILVVQRASTGLSGAVNMVGHVTQPGWRSLADAPTLQALLADRSNLGTEPYMPFVVIKRRNPVTLAPEFHGVDATRLSMGAEDYRLNDQDEVIILSNTDIRYMVSEDVLRAIKGQAPLYGRVGDYNDVREQAISDRENGLSPSRQDPNAPSAPNGATAVGLHPEAAAYLQTCKGLRSLARSGPIAGVAALVEAGKPANVVPDIQPCPEIYDQYADLLLYLMNNVLLLQGAVHSPGLYPVSDGGLLADAIAAAGGLLGQAAPDGVEVTLVRNGTAVRQMIPLSTATADFSIAPQSSVRIRQAFSDMDGGIVFLQGEVRYPGSYTLLRGERLSHLIERAGGLTQEAYILGAVFTRDSVRQAEQESYNRMATDIEMAIPTTAQYISENTESANVGVAMSTLERVAMLIRNAKASGRMVINATPSGLQSNPESDILLHSGDRLFVPRRPAHITITGEVMHSGAQTFEGGLPADEYIKRAGGLRESADEGRIYVILPDGTAQPLSTSYWNYSETQIPPGSTIVVPRDMSPIMWWSLAKNSASILGDIALSAAALATINR